MAETYCAGVYWPGRKDSLEACARRAAAFFQSLGRCDPCLSRWFEQARSFEKALELQFEPDLETLLRQFSKKRDKRGVGGVSFGAWIGGEVEGRGAMVLMRCGLDAPISGNACVLYLPYEEPDVSRVLSAACATAVLRAMDEAWEPEHGLGGGGLGPPARAPPKRLTASNPGHLALMERVRQVLEPAGLLK